MYKILILEDDVMIASGLAYAIESEGYEAVIFLGLSHFFSDETAAFCVLDPEITDALVGIC